MVSLFEELSPEWQVDLFELKSNIDRIDAILQKGSNFLPDRQSIFRALIPKQRAKVLIVGQDPYPNPEHGMGLSFSVPPSCKKLPASLRNIFKELHSDLGEQPRTNGDLSDWQDQGVVMLNRSLTVATGATGSHSQLGWQQVTDKIVEVLADKGVIGILWGNSAQELSSHFSIHNRIESVHPSPLAAYRGFFGSKPFSRANSRLIALGQDPILWG